MTANEGRDGGGDGAGAGGGQPWVTRDGFDADPPWGAGEDSPMDEGSEETAVPEGRRGERRAGRPAGPTGPAGPARLRARWSRPGRRWPGRARHRTRRRARRTFPDDADIGERTEDALRSRGRRS